MALAFSRLLITGGLKSALAYRLATALKIDIIRNDGMVIYSRLRSLLATAIVAVAKPKNAGSTLNVRVSTRFMKSNQVLLIFENFAAKFSAVVNWVGGQKEPVCGRKITYTNGILGNQKVYKDYSVK